MSQTIQTLLWKSVSEIRTYPYFGQGLQCVELCTTSGQILNIRSAEMFEAPFEAYSLITESDACSDVVSESERIDCNMPITSIEVFRRDEWVAHDAPTFGTVGANPKLIETGPSGSAPSGTLATSVICGYALYSSGSPESLLIAVIDYPGLVTLTTDNAQIAALRGNATGELIS